MDAAKFISVSSIEIVEEEDVYDIEVEKIHNFVANGIVVHNCLAGNLSFLISKEYLDVMDAPLDVWLKDKERFERTQKILDAKVELFAEAFGGYENYYPEIQFNKIPQQHLLNWHILNLAKRKNIKIVATADSHYANPDHWRDREIYKAMAWASKTKGTVDPATLPQKIEDLKCELYPKNASQMWESYKKYSTNGVEEFYKGFDEDVCNAIELTHDIAHNHISDDVTMDTKVKLPSIHKLMNKDLYEEFKLKVVNPEDENEITQKYLTKLCVDALKEKKKTTPEYVERLKYELDVIRHLNISKYFITYWKAIAKAEEELFIGCGRGSAGGSFVSYLLGITKADPIKYGLLFSRFLSYKKAGFPDIDSDASDRNRMVELLVELFGQESVAPISTYSQLQLKSLIKDLGRFYAVDYEDLNKRTALIEKEALAGARKNTPGFDRGVWVLTYEEAEEYSPTFNKLVEDYPQIDQHLKVLFKQIRGCFPDSTLILTNTGGKPYKEINKEKDSIGYYDNLGNIKYNQNYELIDQGIKQTYLIELEDGSSIELTEDHEVLTENGYKKVKDLQENDCMVSLLPNNHANLPNVQKRS